MLEIKRIIYKVFWSFYSWPRSDAQIARNYVTLINSSFSLLSLGSPLVWPRGLALSSSWASSFNAAENPDETEMSYLTFAEDFTMNLRIPAALCSDPGHSARFSSLVQSLPRIVRKERVVGRRQGRIHYFPYRRIFRRFMLHSRVRFYPSTRKAELIQLGHSCSTSHPNRIVTQAFTLFKHLSFTLLTKWINSSGKKPRVCWLSYSDGFYKHSLNLTAV